MKRRTRPKIDVIVLIESSLGLRRRLHLLPLIHVCAVPRQSIGGLDGDGLRRREGVRVGVLEGMLDIFGCCGLPHIHAQATEAWLIEELVGLAWLAVEARVLLIVLVPENI